MNVFLGVGMYAWFDFSAASLDWHKEVAQELWRRYGQHSSFYGWYVSEEVYGSLIPDQGEAAKDHYRQEVVPFPRVPELLPQIGPEKPLMLALNAHGMRQSQDVWPLVLRHLDIVCPFAFHRMPPGDITGEESAAIWQRMCDRAGSHLWMAMEAFLFEGEALIPRPIAALIQDLTRFPNFEKTLCYQYPGIFNSPASAVKPGGPRTVALYREYQQYLKTCTRTQIGSPTKASLITSSKLTDSRRLAARRFTHAPWPGIPAGAE